MFKFLETMARNRRMKKHQQNFIEHIKFAENFVTPDDPDFPWVRLDDLRRTNYDVDRMLKDIKSDYEQNSWYYMNHSNWARKDNDVLTFIDGYAPEVQYRRDPARGIYVTTQIVTTSSSEKPLDIEFDGYHLEIADFNGKTVYDLREPINVSDMTDLCIKYNLRVVDNETGTYQTVPRTDAEFRWDASYTLWRGMAQHTIKVSSVTLFTEELVTYKKLPKVSPDDTVKRSAQGVVERGTAYLDVVFENDELERSRKCYEIATNLLERGTSCKNN